MFANYQYFLILAEECNISHAAERLFVTHQCLSKYLSNLEIECGVTLFERKPSFSLTYAGRLMLDTLRQAESLEKNLRSQYSDIRRDQAGEICLGTTEGRFRILMPNILSEFKQAFPEVQLRIVSAASPDLREMVKNNQLDLMIANVTVQPVRTFSSIEILQEKMYLIISDNMLKEYFPGRYPQCKEEFRHGADLRLFQNVPFALNLPNFNSRILLDKHLERLGISLNCVHASSHPDLHHIMSTRDYAASFCLTMYLPSLMKLNHEVGNTLNIFPIQGFTDTNSVAIFHVRNRVFPQHTKTLIQMIRRQCSQFNQFDPQYAGTGSETGQYQ